jgi:hypothetical protein
VGLGVEEDLGVADIVSGGALEIGEGQILDLHPLRRFDAQQVQRQLQLLQRRLGQGQARGPDRRSSALRIGQAA